MQNTCTMFSRIVWKWAIWLAYARARSSFHAAQRQQFAAHGALTLQQLRFFVLMDKDLHVQSDT